MELISIIIPVYNVEKYLHRCLDSVINQSYSNLEILLIDDGSTDSSLQICNEYASRDARIKVIHQENMGLAGARNTGIRNVNSSYFASIDSDDYVDKDFIYKLYNCMSLSNSDIVQCNYVALNNDDNQLIEKSKPSNSELLEFSDYAYLNTLLKEEYHPANILYWNKLYKTELWKDIILPVGNLHDDVYGLTFVIEKAREVTIIPDVLYYYMIREGSITNRQDSNYKIKYALDLNDVYSARYELFKQKGYRDLASETLIEKANIIKNLYRATACLNDSDAKRIFFKRMQTDLISYLLEYFKNKKIESKTKHKLFRHFLRTIKYK